MGEAVRINSLKGSIKLVLKRNLEKEPLNIINYTTAKMWHRKAPNGCNPAVQENPG